MKKGILITGMILSLAAASAMAQDEKSTTMTHEPEDYYRSGEFSLDVIGGLSLDKDTIDHISLQRVSDHGKFGGGLGGSYFFCRYVGISGEAYTESFDQHFLDSAAGHLIGRIPIGNTGLAPYVFGGGGHLFDPISSTEGHGGAGLEFRFNPHFGIFTDARYVFTDHIGNYGMARLGLRFVF